MSKLWEDSEVKRGVAYLLVSIGVWSVKVLFDKYRNRDQAKA